MNRVSSVTLPAIDDARRTLSLMVARVDNGGLSPEAFKALVAEIETRLDEVDIYLEAAGPVSDQKLMQHMMERLSTSRMRFVGKLGVIEGGRE